MKSILVLGALPKSDGEFALYEAIRTVCLQFADEVSTPVETAAFSGSVQERFARAMEKVAGADLIVGEASQPSTGQGIELGVAFRLGKRVVILAREGCKVSGLVQGCPAVERIVSYGGVEELEERLGVALQPK